MVYVEWTWEGLLAKCESLHQMYAPDIEIPTGYIPDVLQVFDHSQLQVNVFWFVTYILWLETQLDISEKYLQVKLNCADLRTKCIDQFCHLQRKTY